ncbi:MAG: UPF0489 family protein [bacterium]|nr:UPF0489 family protein [bacterium]
MPISQSQGKLVGVEPIKDVVMMEDHNEAYFTWQRMGKRDKILLHIDAHIDFAWIDIKDPYQILEEAKSVNEVKRMLEMSILWEQFGKKRESLVNIGNYLYPALRDGIVREVYWVIPGDSKQKITKRENKMIKNIIKRLMKKNPKGSEPVEIKDNCITTRIYGKKFTACRLPDLPRIQEEVLLDIDTDFFVLESILSNNDLIKERRPWFFPEELVEYLKRKEIRTNLVTIAYSVEGGFTPLRYKYLGDELKEILKNTQLEGDFRKITHHRKQADIHRLEGRIDDAIYEYENLLKLKPDDASGCYNLSSLYLEKGLIDKASLFYKKAIKIDPTYRTAYNNLGRLYERNGKLGQAKNEYNKILKLDPEDANAHCGLGSIFSKNKMWDKAIVEYERAIKLSGDDFSAHYGIGYVYIRQGKWDEAKKEFKKCVELDSLNSVAHYWLGFIYSKIEDETLAIQEYNRAIQTGWSDRLAVVVRLLTLTLHNGTFYNVIEAFKRVINLLPKILIFQLRQTLYFTLHLRKG